MLACGDGRLLSHRSAAALWGLMRPRWSPVDVTSVDRDVPGATASCLHRSPLREDERAVEAGIPVTSVARTLLDLAEVLDERSSAAGLRGGGPAEAAPHAASWSGSAHAPGRRKGFPALRRLDRGRRGARHNPLAPGGPLRRVLPRAPRRPARAPSPTSRSSTMRSTPTGRPSASWSSSTAANSTATAPPSSATEPATRAMQAAGYRVIRLTHRRLETEPHRIAHPAPRSSWPRIGASQCR